MQQRLPPDTIEEPHDAGPGRPPGWTEATICEVLTGRLEVDVRSWDFQSTLFWIPPRTEPDSGCESIGLFAVVETNRRFRSLVAGRPAGANYGMRWDARQRRYFLCVLASHSIDDYELRDGGRYLEWKFLDQPGPLRPGHDGKPRIEYDALKRMAWRRDKGAEKAAKAAAKAAAPKRSRTWVVNALPAAAAEPGPEPAPVRRPRPIPIVRDL